jgi:hypothetical protein
MSKMQKFHQRISSKNVRPTVHERKLTTLTRFEHDQAGLFATFEPWFVWGEAAKGAL